VAAESHASALRALVVGTDARYQERAHAVIGELGRVSFAVTEPTDPEAVAMLARHEQADVVVLDATGCELAVAAVVSALASSAPRLGVVVVCEHLTDAARALDALPKWGWTRDLRAAVEHARVHGSPLVTPPGERLRTARRDLRSAAPDPIARR
jgi:CheY-like chemotaxis protein